MQGILRRLLAAFCALASIGAFVAVTAKSSSATGEGSRPNVVLILVDDANHRELDALPNVHNLLTMQGTMFPNYFDTTSACCPARASILSGQYNHNNKVKTNGDAGKFNDGNTIGKWLDDAGYQTAMLGKYKNGYNCRKPVPAGWDDWQAACEKINNQYNYKINDNGTIVSYGKTASDYQADVIRNRTIETINEFSDNEDPFFVYAAPTVPHPPLQTPPRYKNVVVPTIPNVPSFNEADISDKPPWIRQQPLLSSKKRSLIAKAEQTRMRMLLTVDDLVKDVVDTLTARDQLDNTVIMLMNDNGFMRGEHRLQAGKGFIYWESMNSGPLFIRGPGFAPGTVNNSLVGNVDLAPTIAALAGATPDLVIDGKSFLPTLHDPNAFAQRAFLHYASAQQYGPRAAPSPVGHGVRTARYLYFQWTDAAHSEELYDYAVDPYEMDNKASDPDYALVKASLAAILTPLKTCAGASCQATFGNGGPISETTTTTSTTTTTTTTTTTVPEETTTTTVPEETTTTTVAEEETTTTTVAEEETTTTTIEEPLGE